MAISLTTGEAMEPVAWRKVVGDVTRYYAYNEMGEGEPLYAAPVEPLLKDNPFLAEQLQAYIDIARAEALEEAAKVCDDKVAFRWEAPELASAIRSLK